MTIAPLRHLVPGATDPMNVHAPPPHRDHVDSVSQRTYVSFAEAEVDTVAEGVAAGRVVVGA